MKYVAITTVDGLTFSIPVMDNLDNDPEKVIYVEADLLGYPRCINVKDQALEVFHDEVGWDIVEFITSFAIYEK